MATPTIAEERTPPATVERSVASRTTAQVATGVAGAAMLAGGIGGLFLGLLTTGAEISAPLKTALTWLAPVGPLSGKTGVAVIAWLISWIGLHAALKNREVDLGKVFVATLILIGLGVLFTFPTVFEAFATS